MGFHNEVAGIHDALLFIIHCIWEVYFASKAKWKFVKMIISLLASLLLFSTFFEDSHLLKKPELNELD